VLKRVTHHHPPHPPPNQNKQSFPTQLFTAVPSRSFFPRGFLWDEGFHQLLLHKWDLSLTYDVVLHWLGQMHAHKDCAELGWIPREIALGEQAVRRIPREFLPQDVSVANPPTFLLTLEKVLGLDFGAAVSSPAASDGEQQCEEGGGEGRRAEFLTAIQARLDMWVRWLLSSQRGPVPGSFRWRGRGDPGEKLMATTFASGLDDYPRASEPGEEEYHVDLLCWVVKGCQILSRLAAVVEPGGETSKRYETVAEELLVRVRACMRVCLID
jgi:mannosyl-oligosaccharide glucosidase